MTGQSHQRMSAAELEREPNALDYLESTLLP